MDGPYTRYPRTTLWLLHEAEALIGGPGDDSLPQFEAHIEPFYIGKTAITNEEFEVFAPDRVRSPLSPHDESPAVDISFHDAVAYCHWYSEATGRPFRLPTEVEWEYACRAESQTRYPFGESTEQADLYAWSARNSAGALPQVEQLKPNEFGLYGMLGGVWEWTSSLYEPYPVHPEDGRDNLEKAGKRVARGGSFLDAPEAFATAIRRPLDPNEALNNVGFRIVRSLR